MAEIIDRQEKQALMQVMTGMLPVLRAALNISQGELASYVGVSRQTYCALEVGKRPMSWTTFLGLFLFFISNEKTSELLKTQKGFIAQVHGFLQYTQGNLPK